MLDTLSCYLLLFLMVQVGFLIGYGYAVRTHESKGDDK